MVESADTGGGTSRRTLEMKDRARKEAPLTGTMHTTRHDIPAEQREALVALLNGQLEAHLQKG
jgi:hypothetical protein